MRQLTIFLFSLLTSFACFSQGRMKVNSLEADSVKVTNVWYKKLPNIVTTLQELQRVSPIIGNTTQWIDSLQGGQFIVYAKAGFTVDSALVFPHSDTNYVLVRSRTATKEIQLEWFKRPGETDFYNAFVRLANYASANDGTVIRLHHRPYNIDTMKTGTPIMKTNIVERDSIYIDTSGATNDTIIYTIIDTVTTVSQHYIPNDITDITWLDPQNLHIIGDGAVINVKGDFDRKWTHSTASGFTHMSAYNSVCPFQIAWGRNVTIEGVTINGNDDKTTETTPVNEGQAYGMVFRGTDGITINNCYIHHMQTDGLYIEGSGGGADGQNGGKHYHASRSANVQNVRIEYCGRQALTIGGLNVGKFTNCHFDKTGDTTELGTQPYAFRGHAPQKGLDIEPIYELSHSTLIRTDRWTSDITFDNCTFIDNRGGSIAMSHPYTVKNITFTNCTLDNSKYNRLYNVISGIVGVTFDNCDINTGTGGMYLTRDRGTLQRMTVKNNVITSGGSGFLSGSAAQYGVIVEGNLIIGHHDTAYKGYFPVISSNAIFKNNTVVLDSALYLAVGGKHAGEIYSQTAEGNTYVSEVDTTNPAMPIYTIYYTYPKRVTGETYDPKYAVRPGGGWDVAHSDYTTGKVGVGSIQVVNGGYAKPEIKQYWLTSVPTVNPFNDTYKEGDVIWMTRPGVIGYNLYRCISGGDFTKSTPPVFAPVGAVSTSGAPVYHNALTVAGSDYYIGRSIDLGATSKLATGLLPNGGVYITQAANDTGIVAFKSPFTFGSVLADFIIDGSIFIRGKGSVDFTVTGKTNGNNTITSPTLNIKGGDSTLTAIKIKWIRDIANSQYYLGFNDTNTVNVDKTVYSINKITITSATNAFLSTVTTAWTPVLLTSLTGLTATTLTNNNAIDWNTAVYNKPTLSTPVNPDWNATSGLAQILNKPAYGTTINVTGNRTSFTREISAALGSSTIAENVNITNISGNATLVSGQLKLMALWLPVDTTLTGVKWYQSAVGSYTASSENRVGLYSYNTATGIATLVASSTNDGTMWVGSGSNTWNNKAFTTPYVATKGLYFVGILYSASSATTTPVLGLGSTLATSILATSDYSNSGKLISTLSSQTSMPSSITFSTTTVSTTQPYVGLY